MVRYFSLFLLSSLLFPLSLFATDPSFSEDDDGYGGYSRFIAPSLSPVQENAIKEHIFGISFSQMVKAFQKRKLLMINNEEYVPLQKEPLLKSALYKEPVRTNPCYMGGLGPYLLEEKDLKNIPQGVAWFSYFFATAEHDSQTYITVGYTANNNPHWGNILDHPVPFNDPVNHYWHTEGNMNSIMPIRTVNFLLKKV